MRSAQQEVRENALALMDGAESVHAQNINGMLSLLTGPYIGVEIIELMRNRSPRGCGSLTSEAHIFLGKQAICMFIQKTVT